MTIDLPSFVAGILCAWIGINIFMRFGVRRKSPAFEKGERLANTGFQILDLSSNPETWANPEKLESYQRLKAEWERDVQKWKEEVL